MPGSGTTIVGFTIPGYVVMATDGQSTFTPLSVVDKLDDIKTFSYQIGFTGDVICQESLEESLQANPYPDFGSVGEAAYNVTEHINEHHSASWAAEGFSVSLLFVGTYGGSEMYKIRKQEPGIETLAAIGSGASKIREFLQNFQPNPPNNNVFRALDYAYKLIRLATLRCWYIRILFVAEAGTHTTTISQSRNPRRCTSAYDTPSDQGFLTGVFGTERFGY